MKTKKMTERLLWGFTVVAALLTMIVLARAGFRPEGPLTPEQILERLQRTPAAAPSRLFSPHAQADPWRKLTYPVPLDFTWFG